MCETNINQKIDCQSDEFAFGMMWGGINHRKLSVYKKEDVILAVNKAYRDMIQHNLSGFGLKKIYDFKSGRDRILKDKKTQILKSKKQIVKEIKESLSEMLVKVFENGRFDDDVHHQLCNDFIKSFKDKVNKLNESISTLITDNSAEIDTSQISYGLAQKIVNMSFKYLYLFDEKDKDNSDNFKNIFENCHMPIDSYILKYLEKDAEIKMITVGNKERLLKDLRWSALSEPEYKELNEKIKTYCKNNNNLPDSPLFAEFFIWPQAIDKYAEKDPYAAE